MVVNADEGAGEGEDLTEGGQDRRVDDAERWCDECRNNQYHSEAYQHHRKQNLRMLFHNADDFLANTDLTDNTDDFFLANTNLTN